MSPQSGCGQEQCLQWSLKLPPYDLGHQGLHQAGAMLTERNGRHGGSWKWEEKVAESQTQSYRPLERSVRNLSTGKKCGDKSNSDALSRCNMMKMWNCSRASPIHNLSSASTPSISMRPQAQLSDLTSLSPICTRSAQVLTAQVWTVPKVSWTLLQNLGPRTRQPESSRQSKTTKRRSPQEVIGNWLKHPITSTESFNWSLSLYPSLASSPPPQKKKQAESHPFSYHINKYSKQKKGINYITVNWTALIFIKVVICSVKAFLLVLSELVHMQPSLLFKPTQSQSCDVWASKLFGKLQSV